MSGSLIFNHMQALDEGRFADGNVSVGGGPLSPQPSPSNRQESMLMVRTVDEDMSFKEVPNRTSSLVISEEAPPTASTALKQTF